MYRCYIKIIKFGPSPHRNNQTFHTSSRKNPLGVLENLSTTYPNTFPKSKIRTFGKEKSQAPLHLISPNPSLEKNSLPPYVNPRNNSLKGGKKPNSYPLNTFLEKERN